jgi:hypothetical protein
MYVPAPPATPAIGFEGVGVASSAIARELPRVGWPANTTTTTTASLAVRSSTLNVLESHPVTVMAGTRLRSRTRELAVPSACASLRDESALSACACASLEISTCSAPGESSAA